MKGNPMDFLLKPKHIYTAHILDKRGSIDILQNWNNKQRKERDILIQSLTEGR
jgi:hypothetical protein